MLSRFANWFDSLKEPNRFFVFLGMMFGCYVPFTLAMFLNAAFDSHDYLGWKIFLLVIGFVQVFLLTVIAIHRATRK